MPQAGITGTNCNAGYLSDQRIGGKRLSISVIQGILIPFLGTSLGAACVLLMKEQLNVKVQQALTGFAAGIMLAASIWSLLIPSIQQAAFMGRWAFFPAVCGFWLGILLLIFADRIIPHLNQTISKTKNSKGILVKTMMLVLVVTLHNIPEGMAVGVVYAGWISGNSSITLTEALALSIGIAIQNVPEGAIISMPLQADGMKKGKALLCGILSGAVEPVAAALTIIAAGFVVPALPYLLSFAAGAMIYVVVEEMLPEMRMGKNSKLGTVFFAVGFTVMMILDVVFG